MGLRKLTLGRNRSAKSPSTTKPTESPSKIELSPKRTKAKDVTHEIFHTTRSTLETDRESDIANEDVTEDSACCTRSRCGCPDAVHETLLYVGKKLYDCFGDPPTAETKDYVVGVSEIGEEGATLDDATFCCWSGDAVLEEDCEMKTSKKKIFL